MRSLRDAWVVAVFDLFDSLRSRRAVVFLVLYLAGSMAATGLFVHLLGQIEKAVAEQLHVATTERAGTMTATLMESDQFQDVLTGLVGDAELARELVRIPPVALFYGWLAFGFVPILVTLTSAEAIASEVASGSCRFALFRTTRTSWAVGKLAGQAALVAVGIALGGVGAWAVGWFTLAGFEGTSTAWWLVRLGGRGWVFAFSWLGLVLAVSQVTRSVYWARGLAILSLVLGWVAGALLGSEKAAELAPVVAPTLYLLYPGAHRMDLWRPELVDRLPAVVMLLALGATFFSLGHARFLRRDA